MLLYITYYVTVCKLISKSLDQFRISSSTSCSSALEMLENEPDQMRVPSIIACQVSETTVEAGSLLHWNCTRLICTLRPCFGPGLTTVV